MDKVELIVKVLCGYHWESHPPEVTKYRQRVGDLYEEYKSTLDFTTAAELAKEIVLREILEEE